MADYDGDQATRERVLAAGGVAKRRRNLSNKTGGDRLRTGQSKSPKRRPGTPEPEKRIFTDEEVSDSDVSGSKVHSARSKDRSEIIKRTRSRERPPQKDTTTEIEDDFEIIRKIHLSKKEEEEVSEKKREIRETAPPVKELRERVVKEMPPLIEAPRPAPKQEETPKRARPKTLKLKEEIPKAKPRTRSRSRPRRLSTSEEDDEANLALKGKLILKPKGEEELKSELRRRKLMKMKSTEKESQDEEPKPDETKSEDKFEETEPLAGRKPWFFQRWFSRNESEAKSLLPEEVQAEEAEPPTKPEPEPVIEPEPEEEIEEEAEPEVAEPKPVEEPKPAKRRWLITQIFVEWREFKIEYADEYAKIKLLKNRCASSLLLIVLYCGIGGFIFRFTEGAFESFYKCGVKRVKRDFIDTLWGFSQYMPQEDWKSHARTKLLAFENELHAAHEAGMTSYSGQKSWSFLNAVVYALTVVTTIGYGHISPATATGRAITIVYAIFGIPMFLILLADFGKLFTRAIKFLWAFVRRVYYTGSCKKVRKTGAVQDMMKGVQFVYEFARRSSQMPGLDPTATADQQQNNFLKPPEVGVSGFPEGTPETPALSQYEIDDEFNLPISVAITILLVYIFFGASIYCIWEDWSFFESFYFVFISMSTIGFGDYVPHHPIYMMASMVYLVFGLALTSMCINVVQEKLSDTFRQASTKIGATMGLHVVDEDLVVPTEVYEEKPTELNDEKS